MTLPNPVRAAQWTRPKAAVLAVICLLAGIGGGWSIGGFRGAASRINGKSADASTPLVGEAANASPPAANQLKAAADAQAAPLLGRLQSNPKDPVVLTELGNIYYDTHQYAVAADYYQRALQARPADAAVRTDMATAYWFMGKADLALSEFNKALGYSPDSPNALFNRGIVKWQGKKDAEGALADWRELLATDPSYPEKDKVKQMMAEVKKQQTRGPGASGH